jgi:hypothetical protein
VALFGFPLYAAGLSTLTVYNVLFLLGMFTSALAAWALAREMTGDPAASLLAGVVYALLPWRISQAPHLQFQWGTFLPLLLLFLWRFLDSGRRRDLALFVASLAWNALANVHYAIFSVLLVAAVLLGRWLSAQPGEPRRRVLLAGLAAAAAGVVLAPFFYPYALASRLYGFVRSEHEAEWFSGRLSEFLSAGIRNKLYGAITQRWAHPEGDFFPGIVPVAFALFALRRLRRPAASPAKQAPPDRRRRVWIRVLDVAVVAFLAVGAAAKIVPGLAIGSLRLGDASRPVVFATVAAFLRLALAFPTRSRYRDLGDFLRRLPLDPRATLLLAVAAVGLLVAFGLHTPYYRFLFISFGAVFRSIRAPARGIVLFDLALAVLAAWGLSFAAGAAPSFPRRATILGALVLTGVEYRAFPFDLHDVAAEPAPVYRWLARPGVPAGVMEWPLSPMYDFEYQFRSTAHWKPIVNGSSGFFPPDYLRLSEAVSKYPIPDAVWDRAAAVKASVLVFHPHDAPPVVLLGYAEAVRRGLAQGRIELLVDLPHGVDRDFVFRFARAPAFDAGLTSEERRRAAEAFHAMILRPGFDSSPPAIALDFPSERLEISAGAVAHGWAADDSGIARVRVETEIGPAPDAAAGDERGDVARYFPGNPDGARLGYHFPMPDLPPGEHTLTVTAVARDGGERAVRRVLRVR